MPKQITAEEICRTCGLCCMDVSEAPITLDDISRLMTTYGVSYEQAKAMTWTEENSQFIQIESGACPALEFDGGRYTCRAYEGRPEVCRKFECFILEDLKEAYAGNAGLSNIFRGVVDSPMRVESRAAEAVTMYRSFLHWCNVGSMSAEKSPQYWSRLKASLEGARLRNTFPPVKP